MGQQSSKAAGSSIAVREERLNEKASSSVTPSAERVMSYARSTEGAAGLALNKLDTWQNEFDNVSSPWSFLCWPGALNTQP